MSGFQWNSEEGVFVISVIVAYIGAFWFIGHLLWQSKKKETP